MLGEKIDTSKASKILIDDLVKVISPVTKVSKPAIIAFCGESGSGKSVTAKATMQALVEKGLVVYLLQMDDYFRLPPQPTSELRQKSLLHVGPDEVDLQLLDQHIELIKLGHRDFELREMHFKGNQLWMRANDIPKKLDILIVEGTYVSLLEHVDKRIFLQRTYEQTHIHRTARMREPQTELIEKVLKIEHGIVKEFVKMADYVINNKFELVK